MTERWDSLIISSSSSTGLNLPLDVGSYYSLPLFLNVNDCQALRIKSINIPRTYYTIDASGAGPNQLTVALIGNVSGAQFLPIPGGAYTYLQLANYIQTQWFALTGTNISVNFTTSAQFHTIITLIGGVDATLAIGAPQLASPGMGSILGFYLPFAPSTTLISSNVFNLTGPKSINVISPEIFSAMGGRNLISHSVLHNGTDGVYIKAPVIYQISALGNTGDSSVSIYPSDEYQFASPLKISRLSFGLVDENLVPINLNGYSWSISLELRQQKNV
jgi:hypothetical protein